MSDGTHLMTVRELREMIAELPDDDYIAVDGYEGGYSMPVLERQPITDIEPWGPYSRSYNGPWAEAFGNRPVAAKIWVLARS